MSIGKKIRLERIFNRENNRCIIVPMDHGVSVGPCEGLVNMREAVQDMSVGGADAVLMHKGLVRCGHRNCGRNSNRYELERDMLAQMGKVSEATERWGMPLLAMVYARGPKIQNSYDPKLVAHCARVGVELGADVVKVPYSGDIDSFGHVVESCCIPVVIAGGAKMNSTKDFLQVVYDSLQAGGSGLSVGRNVFQHPNRIALVRALRGIVHENWTVEQALESMGEK